MGFYKLKFDKTPGLRSSNDGKDPRSWVRYIKVLVTSLDAHSRCASITNSLSRPVQSLLVVLVFNKQRNKGGHRLLFQASIAPHIHLLHPRSASHPVSLSRPSTAALSFLASFYSLLSRVVLANWPLLLFTLVDICPKHLVFRIGHGTPLLPSHPPPTLHGRVATA